MLANPFRGPDEVECVGVVLFHTRGHSQDVGVEDDVVGLHPHLFRQDAIGTGGNLYATLIGRGLSLLVEAHHHDRSTKALHVAGMSHEDFLAFLQRDTVHDALALHTLQSGRDDLPLAGVDHHGHSGNVGLGGYRIEEGHHLALGIEQTVVHVDVDNQRAILHLLAGNGHRLVVVLLLDEPQELARTRHVATLAYVDKSRMWRGFRGFRSFRGERREERGERIVLLLNLQQVKTTKPQVAGFSNRLMRLFPQHQLPILRNEVGRSAAATANDVYQPLVDELLDLRSHRLGSLVVETKLIGKSGIGIGRYIIRCFAGQLLQIGFHLASPKRAVQSDGENGIAAHRG